MKRVTFRCGELTLEGILHLPRGSGPFACVVVCHPHPLFGGNMDNNVVVAVCQALFAKGIGAFRFNTRGTGRSEGTFGGGSAEEQDVKAALAFIASQAVIDRKRLGIAAYSFGTIPSFAAMPFAQQVQAIAAISPPLSMSRLEGLKGYLRPKLLISGSGDNFTPLSAFDAYFEALPEPKERHVIQGADHFWWGFEDEVGEMASNFFSQALG